MEHATNDQQHVDIEVEGTHAMTSSTSQTEAAD
jgi:hypothetical protein